MYYFLSFNSVCFNNVNHLGSSWGRKAGHKYFKINNILTHIIYRPCYNGFTTIVLISFWAQPGAKYLIATSHIDLPIASTLYHQLVLFPSITSNDIKNASQVVPKYIDSPEEQTTLEEGILSPLQDLHPPPLERGRETSITWTHNMKYSPFSAAVCGTLSFGRLNISIPLSFR